MSIKLKNSYFETIMANQQVFNNILNKPFPAKTGYWIGRAIDKIQSQSKIYFETKQRLIKQYAEVDEKGDLKAKPDEVDENGKITKKSDGSVTWPNNEALANFMKELEELQGIEIDLSMDEIKVDFDLLEEKGITISPIEAMLMPFLRPKNG